MKRRSFLAATALTGIGIGFAPTLTLAQDGSTLDVAIVSDPVTLDPALMASFFELAVQYNIFEPLLHVTPELEIEPGLASYEMPDETTYVLTLKEGLTFHDGTPVDAEAVKANFDRYMDPEVGSPRGSELGPLESVEVTGPLEVTLSLSDPYAPFLQVLSNRAGMMVSPTAVEEMGEDFATQAVGAGPYRVASWTKNSELVLEAFDGYWRGTPAIPRVVFRPIPDETVRINNLRSGTVQLIDGVAPQLVPQIEGDDSLTLKESPGLGFNAFSFNTTAAPFDDPAVRRAFSMAVDPQVIMQAAYFGAAAPAAGPVPPSIGWAHDDSLEVPRNDPEGAKQALADAGVDTPVAVEITVTNSPIYVRIAQILQSQANAAGFDVTINQIDSTSLITVLRERTFDLCMSPWSGRSDPDGNMFNYFTIDGPNNFPGWENEEVDGLLKQARVETDQAARADLYAQAQQIIADEAPLLFLVFPQTLQASEASVEWTQWPDGAFRLQFASMS
ncbi:ABC transporter substrate-binding protein (plasmid) [Roseivivax marinus]|uniref:ABC transporter substrate-binding protein n=1 Tax=Roseivivax marinus TaxID=1379903 RepID=UPI001F04E799|nr:ABC transporter substrate-binding protein [Roseivivax marinus]UMA66837.1 ABC transporter substrate-binding protein [Roseivivax marinus]